MKKTLIHIFGLCLLISFFACDEDSFQPIVEVQIPAHKTRLLVRADWTAGSDSLAVFVSKSRGVLDKTKYPKYPFDTVADAKVELLRNGQLLGTIPYFEAGYHYKKGLFKLDSTAGTVYTIRVSAPNLETVEASQTTQNPFVVLRGGYRRDGAVYTDPFDPFSTPEKGDELNIEFQDNATEENYYFLESVFSNRYFGRVAIFSRDTLNRTFTSAAYLQDIDPNMDNSVLPDRAFSGKSYLWRFWFRPDLYFNPTTFGTGANSFQSRLKKGDRASLTVRSVNKDFALFDKTLKLAYDVNDNPFFTEPVILYSNIKNGYGIFTISRVQTVNFVIP